MLKLKLIAWVSLLVMLSVGCLNAPPTTTPTTTIKKVVVESPTTTLVPKEVIEDREKAIAAGNTGNDANACAGVQDQRTKDICIRDIAIRTNNVDTCDKISTTDLKEKCYLKISELRNDKSICAKISNTVRRTNCENA